MGKLIEIPIGGKYGKLVVVSEEPSLKHPNGRLKRMVKVLCDCGETTIKHWADVKFGATKSCGTCYKEMPVKDHSGERLGRLIVTEKFNRTKEGVFWACQCDCGNIVDVISSRIAGKRIHNCGSCGTPQGAYYWGDVITNKEGTDCEICLIKDRVVTLKDIKSGGIFTTQYGGIKNGGFSNPYHPSVAGQGYFGVGPYMAKEVGEDRHTKEYEDWSSMLKRCYVLGKNHSSYSDKYVSDDWKNFQNFAEWATKQPNFGRDGWQLDKDLLVNGNTVYSEKTCVYLPREINTFITRKRRNDLPLGIDISHKYDGTPFFRVQGRENGKNVYLGMFFDLEEAFMCYKKHKESLAKDLARKWKKELPENAYLALLNYTVNIEN